MVKVGMSVLICVTTYIYVAYVHVAGFCVPLFLETNVQGV